MTTLPMERLRFSIYWLSNPLLTFRKGHLGLPPPYIPQRSPYDRPSNGEQ